MESNARFLNLKFSRFKEDARDNDVAPENPSLQAASVLPLSPTQKQLSNLPKEMQQKKKEKIERFLRRQLGVHHPVAYDKKCGFSEKWEAVNKHPQSPSNSFMQISGKFRWINFTIFPLLIMQLWFISIYRVFEYNSGTWMFVMGLMLEILNLGLKVAVLGGELDSNGEFFG